MVSLLNNKIKIVKLIYNCITTKNNGIFKNKRNYNYNLQKNHFFLRFFNKVETNVS